MPKTSTKTSRSENMFNKMPPCDLEAEERLLHNILDDPDTTISQVRNIISADDFYRRQHQKIYSAMLELDEQGKPIDIVTLVDLLKSQKILEEVGGLYYISQFIENVPVHPDIVRCAQIIKKHSWKRMATSKLLELANYCFDEATEPDKLLADIIDVQSTLAKELPGGNELDELKFDFNSLRLQASITETPHESLNREIEGFGRSELIIVAGRPGMGKSAFVLGLVGHMAIRKKTPIIYCGAQMAGSRIFLRIIAQECKLSFRKLLTGRILPKELGIINKKQQEMNQGGKIQTIIIKETISLLDLMAQVRCAGSEFGLLAIENLQQLVWPGNPYRDKWAQASFMLEKLRDFSYEINLPIVISSQLHRDVDDRADKRPSPADIFGPKAEELSDIILFPYRPNYYEKGQLTEQGRPERDAELLVSKGGPPIILPFTFWGESLRWEERKIDP
ncbi:MAG: replicative DNA helicase [Parcubacteria group bacterium]|jgi:replicative DNA helicase